jgi:hypothetical protein
MKSYGKVTAALVAVWFAVALGASLLQVFSNPAQTVGVAVAIAASTPLIAFLLWFAVSPGFRQFTLGLSPRALTAVQAWRLIGFTFVLLEAHAALPAVFALPAGYGDMLIGATATFAAWKLASPGRRGSFILWQSLGVLDLVNAVAVGVTAPLLAPQGPSMLPMTVLPLSLVPTFLVPLFLILHFICIAQARNWKAEGEGVARSTTPTSFPATSASLG